MRGPESSGIGVAGNCAGTERPSSSIVLRREPRRPAKLDNEFDVDNGPKRHVAQDSGRSLVAIREMRECFTISGRRRIVSKICSFSNCEAPGELGVTPEPPEDEFDRLNLSAAIAFDLKLIALSGSSLVAETRSGCGRCSDYELPGGYGSTFVGHTTQRRSGNKRDRDTVKNQNGDKGMKIRGGKRKREKEITK